MKPTMADTDPKDAHPIDPHPKLESPGDDVRTEPDADDLPIAAQVVDASLQPTPPTSKERPAITTLLGFVSVGIFLFASSIGAAAVLVIEIATGRIAPDEINAWAEQAETNGTVLAVSSIFGALVVVPFVVACAFAVRSDTPRELLALRWPTAKQSVAWIALLLALNAAADLLAWLLGRPVISPFMRETYQNAGSLPLLLVALCVAAPLSEEFIFRGILYRGLVGSRLGVVGAVLISSLVFASLHIQYDFFGIAVVFLIGLFLAAVRQRTASLILCILAHAAVNLVATCQVAVALAL